MPWVNKYSDAFTGVDLSPLPAPWSAILVTGVSEPRIRRVNNGATGINFPDQNQMVYNQPIGNDHSAEQTTAAQPTFPTGVSVRMGINPSRGYIAWRSATIRVVRWTEGAYSDLIGALAYPGGGGTLRMEIKGTIISIYFNGAFLQSVDTHSIAAPWYDTGGFPGLYTETTGTSAVALMDNWKADEWSDATRRRGRHWGGELWDVIPEVAPYLG